MMKKVIIVDEKGLEKKKKGFLKDGKNKIHIVSDFDRTITYGLTTEKNKTPTVISQLRSDPKYLGEKYQGEANKLFDIYHPIEINPSVSLEEKNKKMHEWWRKHFDLLIKFGVSKNLIKRVVKERPLSFRKGTLEFMDFLDKNNIPIVFVSASSGDMLIEYMKKNNLMKQNVYILGNLYEFDSKGKAIQAKEPIIHTFNKTEVSLKDNSFFDKIENRKNVILLGDSIGDVGMIEGFDYDNLIKIGFLNQNVEENLDSYKENFDVVITGDSDFDYVNKLIKEVVK